MHPSAAIERATKGVEPSDNFFSLRSRWVVALVSVAVRESLAFLRDIAVGNLLPEINSGSNPDWSENRYCRRTDLTRVPLTLHVCLKFLC